MIFRTSIVALMISAAPAAADGTVTSTPSVLPDAMVSCVVDASTADDFYVALDQYAPSPVVLTVADATGKNLTVRFDPYEKEPQLRHLVHLDKGRWMAGAWVEPIRSSKDPDKNLSLQPQKCISDGKLATIILVDAANTEKARISLSRRAMPSMESLINGMRSSLTTGLEPAAKPGDTTSVVVNPTAEETILALVRHNIEARAAAWITRRAKEMFCASDSSDPYFHLKHVCGVFTTTSPRELVSDPTALVAAMLRDAIAMSGGALPTNYSDITSEVLKSWLVRNLLEQSIDAIPTRTRKVRGEARLALLALARGPWLNACTADSGTETVTTAKAICGAAIVFGVAADCANRGSCTPDEVLARLNLPSSYYTIAKQSETSLFAKWSANCPTDCTRLLLNATTAVIDLLGKSVLDVQQEVGRYGDILAAIAQGFDEEVASQLHDIARAIEAGDIYSLFSAAYRVFEPSFAKAKKLENLSEGMRLIAAVSAIGSLQTQQLTRAETESRLRALDVWLDEARARGLSKDSVFFSVGFSPGLALGDNRTTQSTTGPISLPGGIAMDILFHTKTPMGLHFEADAADLGGLVNYQGDTSWKRILGLGGSVGFEFASWETPVVLSAGARYTANSETILQLALSVYLRAFDFGF